MNRHLAALALAGLTLAGCRSSSSSDPHLPTALPCPPTRSGTLCIKVIRGADRATVGDVIGYLSSSGTSLDGKTWRLVFYRLADGQAKRFASRVRLCVSEQVRIGGSWPAPRPAVARACSSAPPA